MPTARFDTWVPDGARRLSTRFTEALAVAAELHAAQGRKGTALPYVSHLLGVTALALEYGAGEDEAIAALLHDAIEDAPDALGPEGVRRLIDERFGAGVLAIVEACTDTDARPKPPWRARKAAYLAHVSESPPPALLVSACDKLHNVRAVLDDFRRTGHEVWSRFNPDAGMAGTIGYYRALVLAFRGRTDGTGRYDDLVADLDRAVGALETATGHRGQWPPRG